MGRPTQKSTTPLGKELVTKTYLTARERNELRSIWLSGMKTEFNEAGKPEVKEIKGDMIEKGEHKLIELGIVSYDSSSERILDRLLDATPEEYDFVTAELGKLNTGGFQPAK